MSTRILAINGAVYPKAEIQSINPGEGVVVFRWLTAGGVPVDSGGSIARITPVQPNNAPGAPVAYPDVSDATLIAAIENPPAPTARAVFDYTQFVAYCDARVPGFTARVLTAARSSTDVQNWINVAVSRNTVHLDAPELADAFALFISAGLMTAAERTAILAP